MTVSAALEPCVWHPTSATQENAVAVVTAIHSLENFTCLTSVFFVLEAPEQTAVQALDTQGIPYRAWQSNGPLQMRRGKGNDLAVEDIR
jgi:hypothetical protein